MHRFRSSIGGLDGPTENRLVLYTARIDQPMLPEDCYWFGAFPLGEADTE